MKHIAILGGTFNPIHNAHLAMAHHVYQTGLFDEIWFMPTGDPPHKEWGIVVDKSHRWQMSLLAIKGYDHFVLSDVEINRTGKTYTVDTILELKKTQPLNDYYLIIGADSLMDLTKWYNTDLLFKICQFVVINRPGYEQLFNEQLELLRTQHGAHLQVVDVPLMDISSTDIRQCCQEDKSISNMVPPDVEIYIKTHQLYKNSTVDLSSLEEKLQSKLSSKRFSHSIAVKNTAISLAKCYNCNIHQAAIAGLLHDCAKAIEHKKKIRLCEKHGIEVTPAEIENPDLLHAKLGAIVAKEKYGINDLEILNAIECHTTGKPLMTLLDKVIFIADYIEPTRNKAPRLDYLRALSEKSLDDTLLEILKDTLDYLKLSNKVIDSKTEETYLYYKSLS